MLDDELLVRIYISDSQSCLYDMHNFHFSHPPALIIFKFLSILSITSLPFLLKTKTKGSEPFSSKKKLNGEF
jgi:hypothetical protein